MLLLKALIAYLKGNTISFFELTHHEQKVLGDLFLKEPAANSLEYTDGERPALLATPFAIFYGDKLVTNVPK